MQGPASRFGDTAANTGILTLLDSFDETKKLPVRPHSSARGGPWGPLQLREGGLECREKGATHTGEGQGTDCRKWVSVLRD